MSSFMEFTSYKLPLPDRHVVVHEVTEQRGFFSLQSILNDPSVRIRMPQGVEPQVCIEGDNGKAYVDPDGKVYIPADETEFDLLGIVDTAGVRILRGSELTLSLQTETGRRDLPLGCVKTIQVSQRR